MMRLRAMALLFVLPGCVATSPQARMTAPDPVFSPMTFFAGDTVGEGSLKVATRRTRSVHVVGHGDIAADGTLVLVQHVRQGSGAERTRTWRIRPVGGDHYAGTLSDALGPVAIDAHGNTLHIAYRARGGLRIGQWLSLQPGGQVAFNWMVVHKFGLRIAVLRETITRR